MDWGLALGMLGAAVAAFLAGGGSSIGIGLAGQASCGVLSEQPEKFGTLLLLTALPGTQGVYGFLSAFLVILKLGLLGGSIPTITIHQGLAIFGACLPVAVAGFISGVHQGKVCAAGVMMTAKQPKDFVKPLILGALVETYAVLGLLITILLLNGIKVG